jgi:hypothetical protein
MFHNTSGVSMLLKFVIGWSLIIQTHCGAVELAASLRGILCFENSQNDTKVTDHHISVMLPPTLRQVYLDNHGSEKVWQTGHTNMVPVTIFLDTNYAHGQQIRKALALCSQLDTVHCPLDERVCISVLDFYNRLLIWSVIPIHPCWPTSSDRGNKQGFASDN